MKEEYFDRFGREMDGQHKTLGNQRSFFQQEFQNKRMEVLAFLWEKFKKVDAAYHFDCYEKFYAYINKAATKRAQYVYRKGKDQILTHESQDNEMLSTLPEQEERLHRERKSEEIHGLLKIRIARDRKTQKDCKQIIRWVLKDPERYIHIHNGVLQFHQSRLEDKTGFSRSKVVRLLGKIKKAVENQGIQL